MKQPGPFVRAASCFTHERAGEFAYAGWPWRDLCTASRRWFGNSLARSNTRLQSTLTAWSLLSSLDGAATKYVDRDLGVSPLHVEATRPLVVRGGC
jgi:hypothetical protein